jgi:hypothetical protein
VEVVAATINALLDNAPDDSDPNDAPFEDKDTPRLKRISSPAGRGISLQIPGVSRGPATTCSTPAIS